MPRAKKPPAHPLEEAGARRGDLPGAIAPQLATLLSAVPTVGEWSYEIKFDGYRLMVRLQAGTPTLITRGGHDWTDRMKDLKKSLAGLPVDTAWFDGEVVVLNSGGLPDFNALQNAFDRRSTTNLTYFVFDLLYLNGYDLREVRCGPGARCSPS
jgi:bifunctional non-homologous end joining protein LigD